MYKSTNSLEKALMLGREEREEDDQCKVDVLNSVKVTMSALKEEVWE